MAWQGGKLNKGFISAISLLDQREIFNKVLDQTNEAASFMDIMELTGRSVPTSQPVYHQFVNDELWVVGTISAESGTGAQITITIDATAAAAVQEGTIGLLADGTNVRVQSVSGNDIVIRNVDGTTALEAKVSASSPTNKIAFPSTAFGEGSSGPRGDRWGYSKYDNQVQIFKRSYNITDIQKASTIEVEIDGKPYPFYKLAAESLMKFRGEIAFQMFVGQKSAANFSSGSPSLVDSAGNPVQTTMGFDQYATDYGVVDTLASSAEVDLADMARLNTTLNTNRAPLEYLWFVGTPMNIKYDDFFNALSNSGALSTAGRFSLDGRDLDFGVDSYKMYGRTFHKKYLPLLDHKNVLNFTDSSAFKNNAYGVPMGKVKTIDGDSVDSFRLRYLSGDGYDGRYLEKHLGGLAPTETDSREVHEVVFTSVQGLEVLAPAWVVKQKAS